MIKACLFDLDGVVFDTESLYTHFWEQIGKSYCPEITNFAQIIKGQTLFQIYDRFFPNDPNLQENITHKLNNYEHNMDYDYVDGFESFIKNIKQNRIKTAIVTSSNNAKMENVYRKRPEVKGYFNEILTSEDFDESKPSPDCYYKAAQRLGFSPKQCIVFEDSINGLKSGKAFGGRLIGLATTHSKEDLVTFTSEIISNYNNFNI